MSEGLPTRVASRLIVGLEGPWPTAREAAWLACWQPAGVILFARNVQGPEQVRRLCAALRQLVPSLEISADQEGGPVSPLAAAVGRAPAAWALGTLGDEQLTREVHAETARRLSDLGLNRVWAPVADVMTEARNPVIGVRAFGAETRQVQSQVAAAVQGLQEGGLACCLKHWPGHGASTTDSHQAPARGEADSGEAAISPSFLAGLATGAAAVMVGHLGGPGAQDPATMDAQRLDRARDGFTRAAGQQVMLVADDVTMGALRVSMARQGIEAGDEGDHAAGMVDPARLPLAWLARFVEAGLDRLLIRGIPWQALPLPVSPSEPDLDAQPSQPGEFHEPALSPLLRAGELLAAVVRSGFDPAGSGTGWLDLTANDRWEVAGGESATARRSFTELVQGGPGYLLMGDDLSTRSTKMVDRLLITSHRPLPAGFSALLPPLAGGGQCLVAGHPALAAEMGGFLSEDWSVTACHDVDWRILAQVWQGP